MVFYRTAQTSHSFGEAGRTRMTRKNRGLLSFPESIRGQNLSQDYESLELVLVFLYKMEILFSSISVGPAETKEVYIINSGRGIFSTDIEMTNSNVLAG